VASTAGTVGGTGPSRVGAAQGCQTGPAARRTAPWPTAARVILVRCPMKAGAAPRETAPSVERWFARPVSRAASPHIRSFGEETQVLVDPANAGRPGAPANGGPA
jgi:hypothetical protein